MIPCPAQSPKNSNSSHNTGLDEPLWAIPLHPEKALPSYPESSILKNGPILSLRSYTTE
jgi:hypothetical protein